MARSSGRHIKSVAASDQFLLLLQGRYLTLHLQQTPCELALQTPWHLLLP